MTNSFPASSFPTPIGKVLRQPRVALFQAFWKLHSSTIFAALMLSRAGYCVELFLFHVDEVVHTCMLRDAIGIVVHDLTPRKTTTYDSDTFVGKSIYHSAANTLKSLQQRIITATTRNLGRGLTFVRFVTRSDRGLIPDQIITRSLKLLRNGEYKALIGIDKGGLIWAGRMATRLGLPLIYSNLELYTRDHWFCSSCYTQRRLKLGEEKYHRQCLATIVQDEARGRVLLADNRVRVTDMRMLYVPISRLGPTHTKKERWLQQRLGLPYDQVVVLSHGLIASMRFSLDIAIVAQTFPSNWTVVFHGYGEESVIENIRKADIHSRVCLSLELVDVSEESTVVSSATISLSFYGNKYLNDELTGFSSEKLALSLQCGVPVIAFDYPGYSHIRTEGCGILIRELSEIPEAITKILTDYSGYRSRAFSTFDKYYRFESNFMKVMNALDELP
jgi:glycosyltransferase involved in cell wall biosynthesis